LRGGWGGQKKGAGRIWRRLPGRIGPYTLRRKKRKKEEHWFSESDPKKKRASLKRGKRWRKEKKKEVDVWARFLASDFTGAERGGKKKKKRREEKREEMSKRTYHQRQARKNVRTIKTTGRLSSPFGKGERRKRKKNAF